LNPFGFPFGTSSILSRVGDDGVDGNDGDIRREGEPGGDGDEGDPIRSFGATTRDGDMGEALGADFPFAAMA
jgi:hypothetical protein